MSKRLLPGPNISMVVFRRFLAWWPVLLIVFYSCRAQPATTKDPSGRAGTAGREPPDSPAGANSRTVSAPLSADAISTAQKFTPPDVAPVQWHDLLPLIDVKQDKLWGEWRIANRE